MRRASRTFVGMLGVLATVLLHSALLAVAIWDGATALPAKLPEAVGAGANSGSPQGSSEERMLVIQLQQDTTESLQIPAELPVLMEPVKSPSMLAITGPDDLPLPPLVWSDAEDALETSDADMMARTKLAGLYEGQIRARIERAWLKPGEPLEAAEFSCRVKITQDARGYVQEVQLQHCNGSWDWQMSVGNAVFAASPLPAPPNPTVFVDAFSMTFRARPDLTAGPVSQ